MDGPCILKKPFSFEVCHVFFFDSGRLGHSNDERIYVSIADERERRNLKKRIEEALREGDSIPNFKFPISNVMHKKSSSR